jgi:hypothetical protein
MAQTTTARSMRNVKLEWGTGGTWYDISGVANSVNVSGGDRITGEAFTADGDRPIVLFGKLNSIDVEAKIVYSVNSTEAWSALEPLYTGGTDLLLRWTPGGDATGNYRFVTDTTNLTQFGYPGGEVQDGAPIMVDMAVKTGKITWATLTGVGT